MLSTASTLKDNYQLENHPLFGKLMSNEIPPQKFGQIVAPFYFAVEQWKNTLFEFYSVLTLPSHREMIMDNICDEMGWDNGKPCPQKAHVLTFNQFLIALGLDTTPHSTFAVQDFNFQIRQFFKNSQVSSISCFLGALEFFYVDISMLIQKYCDMNNIKQIHYQVHSEIDLEHAKNFFIIAEELQIPSPETIYCLNFGYSLLWKVFLDFFVDFQ